jgi:ABC-type molybdenum transport system ATPase subunit/photorepair protein PhrA
VGGLTSRVAAGERYGLLGPNGASKPTIVGMVGILVRPTSGRGSLAGFDVAAQLRQVRRRIGFRDAGGRCRYVRDRARLLVLQGDYTGSDAASTPAARSCFWRSRTCPRAAQTSSRPHPIAYLNHPPVPVVR